MSALLLILFLLACAALPVLLMPARIATRHNTREARLVSRIHSLLPQTQCRECGYDGCLPYAQAVAAEHHHRVREAIDGRLRGLLHLEQLTE